MNGIKRLKRGEKSWQNKKKTFLYLKTRSSRDGYPAMKQIILIT